MSLAFVPLDWIQVNSSAAVPTTSTSITMPFRKNLGFKRSLRGRMGDDRAPPDGFEYSVGGRNGFMTEVLPRVIGSDAGRPQMVASPRMKVSIPRGAPIGWVAAVPENQKARRVDRRASRSCLIGSG